jgi:hypothetical protein
MFDKKKKYLNIYGTEIGIYIKATFVILSFVE